MKWEVAPPTTVAIFGSCVTRDVFNSRFVPGYAGVFTSVAYAGQTSIISLMDRPAEVPDLADLEIAVQREIGKEFSRQLLTDITALHPEYLILDFFADVHFGCIEWNGHLVTRNRWKFLKSEAYGKDGPHSEHPVGTDEYAEMWSLALDRFLKFVRDNSPQTKVVLHRARNVVETVSADGTIIPFGSPKAARKMNRWWDRLDEIALSKGVQRVIDVFDDETRTSDDHPWGAFYVHYRADYSQRFFAALVSVALTDARASAASPSRISRLRMRRSR